VVTASAVPLAPGCLPPAETSNSPGSTTRGPLEFAYEEKTALLSFELEGLQARGGEDSVLTSGEP